LTLGGKGHARQGSGSTLYDPMLRDAHIRETQVRGHRETRGGVYEIC